MDDGSISGSLDRIEAALERIEAAARVRAAKEPADSGAPDTNLELRHRALQTAVEDALARIDTLIGEQS